MRTYSLLNTAAALTIACWLLASSSAMSQRLYSLGASSVLQEIDIATHEVTDLVTVIPSLSDIAFHPDGTLYGVNEHTIYSVNINDGSTQEIATLPASLGWLVGLSIDYKGNFYMSSLGGGSDHVIKYNPESGNVSDLGKSGYNHWDLAFYNGKLYLSAGTDQPDVGLLIEANLDDLVSSQIVMDYKVQAYGMSSFNDPCTGHELIAAVLDTITYLDPEAGDFQKVGVTDPEYTTSSGTASRTGYLGSLPEFEVALEIDGDIPCDSSGLVTLRAELMTNRPGVQYSLDGINFQDSPVFPDLELGTFRVTLRDSLGCIFVSDPLALELFEPQLTIDASPANCKKDNGVISLEEENGLELEYTIDGINWNSTGVFTQLAAGNYTVTIRNANGCETFVEATIQQVEPLRHAFNSTPEHCLMEDATIEVLAEGGQGPYVYSLVALPDQANPLFTNLHAGTYSVRTSDALGCQVQDLVDIDMIEGPTLDEIIVDDAHCSMADGSAVLVASGGTGELSYSINGNSYPDNNITGLTQGVYNVTVADEIGCIAQSAFAVSSEDGPSITAVNTSNDNCFSPVGQIEIIASGLSSIQYSIDGNTYLSTNTFDNLAAGEYPVIVMDEYGCEAISMVTVEMDPAPEVMDMQLTPATCGNDNGSITLAASGVGQLAYSLENGPSGQQPVFDNLADGLFTVVITDENGCSTEQEISIERIEPIFIESILTTEETCLGNDGTIRIVLSNTDPEATYLVNGVEAINGSLVTGLTSSDYTITTIDGNGCMDSAFAFVDEVPGITLYEIEVSHATCGETDGKIFLDVSEMTEVMLGSISVGQESLLTDLASDNYTITILGEDHCRLDTVVTVKTVGCDVFVPNVFSPNGDGNNDVLKPSFDPAEVSIKSFDIYDRWGNRIFSCGDACEWDGRDHGELVPAGVYVYYISSEDVYGNSNLQTGDITILR